MSILLISLLFTSIVTCLELFPNIVDASHASSDAATFFNQYFTAKSHHDADAWLHFFDSAQTYYFDAAVGGGATNHSSWVNQTHYYTGLWGEGALSYPVRILGDLVHGAIVHFTDTAEIFGDELRIFSAIDFRKKKIIRQVDYWDGRGTNFIKMRVPNEQYDKRLGVDFVKEKASPVMRNVSNKLQQHLSANDFTAAASMFSYDGVFEDFTLRARQEGRAAIESYFHRVLSSVPYGKGATVRHILGTCEAGGYEWYAKTSLDVLNGISALELDDKHSITRMTVVWESSRVQKDKIKAMASKSVIV